MDLSVRNSDPNLGLKEQKISNRKYQKLAMEKKRRTRFNRLLNELKFMVLKSMGRDNVRFAKLEKTEILDLTYRYMKYLNFRLKNRYSDDQIECTDAQKELIDFISKFEREKNSTTPTTADEVSSPLPSPSSSPSLSPSPSPPVPQQPPTYSTPYAFTHPTMVPVTLPYVIERPIGSTTLDNIGTTDMIRNPIPSVSVVNPQTIPAHFIKNEYVPYGYCVPAFSGQFTQSMGGQTVYSPTPLTKDPSPKVWRPWTMCQ